MKTLILFLIRFYQKTLSLDQGFLGSFFPKGGCRFYPTCSQYTYQAIEDFGLVKGLFLGIKRILRCHPWHPGGLDPLKDSSL